MDWIETWFGVSPDGGDGSLEMLYLVAIGVAAVLLFVACYGPARRAVQRRFGFGRARRAGYR